LGLAKEDRKIRYAKEIKDEATATIVSVGDN
jgi:hypothetical protein